MDCRKFEMTIVSAENLPDVRKMYNQMKFYAEVSFKGSDLKMTKKSDADGERETNPRWDFHVDYIFNEAAVQSAGVVISIKIYCKKTFSDDRYVGEVNIPLKSLFDAGLHSEKIISYDVAGTPKGKLNISYSFGDRFIAPKSAGHMKKAIVCAIVVHGAWALATGDVITPIISGVGAIFGG